MGNRAIWLKTSISYNCNRDCSFCHNRYKDLGLSRYSMSENTIKRLAEIYKNHVDKYGQSVYSMLAILGGEPLLIIDKVKLLLSEFREISPQMKLKINTNGDLLDEDILKWFNEYNVSIFLSTNESPLDVIEKQLKLLKQLESKFVVRTILTEKEILRLKELFLLFSGYIKVIRLRPQWPINNDYYLKLYGETLLSTIQWLLDNGMIFDLTCDAMVLPDDGIFRHMCGKREFTIDPDGSIGFCPREEYFVGNIWDDNIDFWEIAKKAPWVFHYEHISKCANCEFKTICGGGCPSFKKYIYGRTNVPTPMCEINKKIIPLLWQMKKRLEKVNGS